MDTHISSAVKAALQEYRFKLELHAHSSPASTCSEIPPELLVENYSDLGYNAVVLTNHFTAEHILQGNFEVLVDEYLEDYLHAKKRGDELGLNVILGAEIRFLENCNDYLVYGINRDELLRICEFFAYGEIKDFYTGFKNDKNVIIQAHPLRNGIELVEQEYLDGIEAFNMHPNHNSRVGVAAGIARERGQLLLAGTDYHHPGHEGIAAMKSRVLPSDSYELAQLLKSRDYYFEIGGCTLLDI